MASEFLRLLEVLSAASRAGVLSQVIDLLLAAARADTGLQTQQDRIEAKIDQLLKNERTIIMDLTTLQAQVEQTLTVEQSAVTLINGLAAQIAAAADDPAKVSALAAQLKSSADTLAAAITANTPAAPAA